MNKLYADKDLSDLVCLLIKIYSEYVKFHMQFQAKDEFSNIMVKILTLINKT